MAGLGSQRKPASALSVVAIVLVINLLEAIRPLAQAHLRQRAQNQKGNSSRANLASIGDRGHGFQWLRRELAAKEQDHVGYRIKICLPDAPERPLTAADGHKKTAWFDLTAMPISPEEPSDPEGLSQAIEVVLKLVEDQIADGIPAERVVIGGFSQGAALAAWAAAECPRKLGGVVLWSGYCPRAKELPAKLRSSPNGKNVPFIWAHGENDTKVLPACGNQLISSLVEAGVTIRSRSTYAGLDHGCTRDSIAKLAGLLQEVAPLEGLAAMKEVTKKGARRKED